MSICLLDVGSVVTDAEYRLHDKALLFHSQPNAELALAPVNDYLDVSCEQDTMLT